MEETRKKRRIRWFPIVVCFIILVNIGAIFYVLNYLWNYLEEFEAAQPVGTMERYISELEGRDYETIMK